MLRHSSGISHHQHQRQHRHHQSPAPAAHDTMAASASTTFSLFFPLHTNEAEFAHVATMATTDGFVDEESHSSSVTTSPSSPSSSSTGSVDCTLSLGTPSSRRAAADNVKQLRPACQLASSCGAVSSWDVAAATGADQSYCCCCFCQGGSRPAAAAPTAMNKSAVVQCAGHGHGHGQDPMLVDRRCANCGTSSTPLWRNGPRGPKTLCNACGIRFKKEERRAAAMATATAMDQGGGCGYFAQHQRVQYGAAVAPVAYGGCEAAPAAFPCGGGGDVTDAEAAAVPPQFLAWRLDVVAPAQAAAFASVWPERTTLFQYN